MITLAIVTCGSILAELSLGKGFKGVGLEIRDHACDDVIEKLLFYWTGIEPTVELSSPSHLKTITHSVRPYACASHEPVKK